MIPKKIYLSKEELEDTLTGERMVSIDEPYDVMTEEYVNLKHVWHDASEMPSRTSCEILYEIRSDNGFEVAYLPEGLTADNWMNIIEVYGIVRWAYLRDLLPKGGEQ